MPSSGHAQVHGHTYLASLPGYSGKKRVARRCCRRLPDEDLSVREVRIRCEQQEAGRGHPSLIAAAWPGCSAYLHASVQGCGRPCRRSLTSACAAARIVLLQLPRRHRPGRGHCAHAARLWAAHPEGGWGWGGWRGASLLGEGVPPSSAGPGRAGLCLRGAHLGSGRTLRPTAPPPPPPKNASPVRATSAPTASGASSSSGSASHQVRPPAQTSGLGAAGRAARKRRRSPRCSASGLPTAAAAATLSARLWAAVLPHTLHACPPVPLQACRRAGSCSSRGWRPSAPPAPTPCSSCGGGARCPRSSSPSCYRCGLGRGRGASHGGLQQP